MGFGVVFAERQFEGDRFAGKIRISIFGVVENDDVGVHTHSFMAYSSGISWNVRTLKYLQKILKARFL